MNLLALTHPEPEWMVPAIVGISLVLGIAVFFGIFWFARRFARAAEHSLARCLANVSRREQPESGDVRIEFEVYFGLLGNGVDRKYTFWLPASEGRIVVERLHHFNCRWGWLMLGPLAPLLSAINHRRVVRRLSAF